MQPLLVNCESGSRERCIESDASHRSVFLRVLLLTCLLLGAGCQDVGTTWSAEARSPDGRWLATARTQQWGGPGTAYDATTVYLKQVTVSEAPTQVLVFSHQYDTMNLKMEWLTPTHLEVRYGASTRPGDRVSLDFQVAKFHGIDISVKELPGVASKSR